MKKASALIILIIMISGVLYAGVGTTAVDILKIPTGIKSQGVGGAYIAISDGVEGIEINPGGLGLIEKQEIMLIHDMYIEGVMNESIFYGYTFEKAGTIGAGIKILTTGNIKQTLETDAGEYAGEGDDVSGFNYSAEIAYSTKLSNFIYSDFTKNLNLGIGLKISGENLEDYSNFSISADVGGIYTFIIEEEDFLSNRGQFLWNKAGVGVVFRNLGTSFNAGVTPISMGLGLYTQFLNVGIAKNKVRISADADYNMDNGINLRYGLEYEQNIEAFVFAIRAGGNFNPEERLAGGFTLGGGIGMKQGNVKYSLDYVYLPYNELGSVHKMGLNVKF
ncbi:MAG TPA: hypothetical protein PLF61_00180 [Candidatus Goldiibacteriota bacterium]|nr:hypothetical protein [Candidatus Goldiibacteriota bacterium]